MPDTTRQSKRWTLTRSALESVLARLDSDAERAAAKYQALHARVASLLLWWGASDPLTLADETLDRVAIKLTEGASVPDASLHAYIRSVAHLVLQESLRADQREARAQRDAEGRWDAEHGGRIDRMHETLDRCLETLSFAERDLILGYYAAEQGSNIATRRNLAATLGVSAAALRIRAHRVRERLEQCVGASARTDDETF